MDADPNEKQTKISQSETEKPTTKNEISVIGYLNLTLHTFFQHLIDLDFRFLPKYLLMRDVSRKVEHLSEQPAINIPAQTSQAIPQMLDDSISSIAGGGTEQAVNSAPSGTVEFINTPDENMVRVNISAEFPKGLTLHLTLRGETSQPGEPRAIVQFGKNAAPETPAREAATARPTVKPSQHLDTLFVKIAGLLRLFRERADAALIGLALLVYALLVSIGIDRFPIYFFTDEAIHMNLAANFIRDGFKNYFGELFPTFFTIEGWVNGTSVYVQLIPYLIFGKSVIVTRLVSALISLLGALAVTLLLKNVLKFKTHWIGILLVLTTPAWFLHARTAFEYVEVGSFYAMFLYFYSRYRTGDIHYIYYALVAGALTFYTHGLGQILMGVTGIALLVMDFRYHFAAERRKIILRATGLLVLLSLPFARYYIAHPDEAAGQMMRRQSYWTNPDFTSLGKLAEFFHQYINGLNPIYWYSPDSVDLIRHVMKGYGNGLWFTLPLAVLGLIITIRNLRQPAYRILLVALLTCPVPASMVAIGMPRTLWMTIPLAILTAVGVERLVTWLAGKFNFKFAYIQLILVAVLVSGSFMMLTDALQNGPIWYTDYGLYGMQYGTLQIFGDFIQPDLVQHPERKYVVSPSWANGASQFLEFFIPTASQSRVHLGQPVDYLNEIRTNPDNTIFVATTDEYNKILATQHFKNIQIQKIIYYPDKTPGFYILTLHAVDNLDELLKAEHEAKIKPIEDDALINSVTYQVWHSPFGMGQISDVFDTDPNTLIRGLEANPLVLDLHPASPQVVHGITFKLGSMPKFTITISLYAPQSESPIEYKQTFTNLPGEQEFSMNFDRGPAQVSRILIQINDELSGKTGQIHVRTILLH